MIRNSATYVELLMVHNKYEKEREAQMRGIERETFSHEINIDKRWDEEIMF